MCHWNSTIHCTCCRYVSLGHFVKAPAEFIFLSCSSPGNVFGYTFTLVPWIWGLYNTDFDTFSLKLTTWIFQFFFFHQPDFISIFLFLIEQGLANLFEIGSYFLGYRLMPRSIYHFYSTQLWNNKFAQITFLRYYS